MGLEVEMGGFKLGDLFKNDTFLQGLSSIGSSIATGPTGMKNPFVAGLDSFVQSNLMNKNFLKLLKGGGKIAIDKDATKLHIPHTTQDTTSPVEGASAAEMGAGDQVDGAENSSLGANVLKALSMILGGGMGTSNQTGGPVNPFGDASDIKLSDLAGLNPEMISNAMGLKLKQSELAQKSINDLNDMSYRNAVLAQNAPHIQSQTALNKAQAENLTPSIQVPGVPVPMNMDDYIKWENNNKVEPLDKLSPYTVPGIGRVTNRQFQALPDNEKNYSIYATALGPNVKPMSRKEFDKMEPTAQGKFLNELMSDPKKMAAEIKLRQSGATAINTFDQGIQRGKAAAITDVTAPDFVSNIIKDLSKSDDWDYSSEIKRFATENKVSSSDAKKIIQKKSTIKEMDARIRQAFKENEVVRKVDGWYVDGKLIVRNPYARQ
jgi:hypothetical protein